MKIFINDNELDFSLENEKVCGEILNQLQVEFEKDNGQSIQLNIMKWGRNSQKYDLRVWDEEKPLKGMTLTEAEVVHLFEELNKKYGKGDVPSITPEVKDSFNMKQFRMVDLKKILIEHPE